MMTDRAPRAHVTVGDGCRLAYHLEGLADAPVLLLSNSLGTTLEMWSPQMAAFARRFRVLRYDTRGHGASDAPPGAYSMDRLGRDAIELLDALDIARVHLCGLSLGGMLGQWLGVRAPERVDRMVLACTSPYMGPPTMWQQRIDTLRNDGPSALADGVIGRWFTPAFGERAPNDVAVVRDMIRSMSPDGYAGCCAAIRDMDLRPTASLIARPTRFVAGAHDQGAPAAQMEAVAAAMHVEVDVVRLDASHLANVEQPDAFADTVVEFLSMRSSEAA